LEFGLSFVHMPGSVRPLLLIVAAAMVLVLAVFFMHLNHGPVVIRGFAVVAVFWMIVLIGPGSMDPLTRIQYPTPVDHPR